eukprot:scaffold131958_cov31-Tisochrysis_lutea.AAC.1
MARRRAGSQRPQRGAALSDRRSTGPPLRLLRAVDARTPSAHPPCRRLRPPRPQSHRPLLQLPPHHPPRWPPPDANRPPTQCRSHPHRQLIYPRRAAGSAPSRAPKGRRFPPPRLSCAPLLR